MTGVVPSHFDSIRDCHCLRDRLLQTMKSPNCNCPGKLWRGNPVWHLCWLACLSYPQITQQSSSLGASAAWTDSASTLPMSAASQCILITLLMLFCVFAELTRSLHVIGLPTLLLSCQREWQSLPLNGMFLSHWMDGKLKERSSPKRGKPPWHPSSVCKRETQHPL